MWGLISTDIFFSFNRAKLTVSSCFVVQSYANLDLCLCWMLQSETCDTVSKCWSIFDSPACFCVSSVYTDSGFCQEPLPPTLSPSESGRVLFVKTPHAARGSVGVFTYDLHNQSTKQYDGKVAVMFSNPYDFNLYSNWYAVGVFDKSTKCDKSLFEEMYYNSEREFVRVKAKECSLTYKGESVTIRATISDSYTPVIKIQVCTNWNMKHL